MDYKKELLKKLKFQYDFEKLARDVYSKDIKKLTDKKVIKTIQSIIEDEKRHMIAVEEMIDIVKKTDLKVKEVKAGKGTKGKKLKIKRESTEHIKSKIFSVVKELEKRDCILISDTVGNYFKDIIDLLTLEKSHRFLYVSYNKVPKYTKATLKEQGVDPNKIIFVNCSGIPNNEDINLKPEELVKLSIVITETAKRIKNLFVLFDSLSSMPTYHTPQVITRFVSSVNDHAREKGYKIIWIVINESIPTTLYNQLCPLFDKVISLK